MAKKKYLSLERLSEYHSLLIEKINTLLSAKADASHTHADIEINKTKIAGLESALNGKADATHNHDDAYDVKGAANNALTSAQQYTDGHISYIIDSTLDDETITPAIKAVKDASGNVITATYETKTDATSKLAEAKTYADDAATKVKNDLLNGAGAAYDTLKELGELIDDNTDAIDALTGIASGKADAQHTHLMAEVTGLGEALDAKAEVADLEALQGVVNGKANATHSHAISEVTDLQTTLDGYVGRIGALETKVGDGFEEITSAEISNLFAE